MLLSLDTPDASGVSLNQAIARKSNKASNNEALNINTSTPSCIKKREANDKLECEESGTGNMKPSLTMPVEDEKKLARECCCGDGDESRFNILGTTSDELTLNIPVINDKEAVRRELCNGKETPSWT
jgi:hypothetical protein